VGASVSESDNAVEFNKYFLEIYGDRWTKILAALLGPEIQVARWNQLLDAKMVNRKELKNLSGAYYWQGGELARVPEGLILEYVMDPASILAARALEVEMGDRVLDMCAAPGGKALILAEALKEGGELIANELSPQRRERLTKVIQQYVPKEIRNRIWVTGKEAGLYASQTAMKFDRILLDAPCSGERHLLGNVKEMSQWSLARSRKLALRQYALISGALEGLNNGGRMVYSTCTINPIENDGVVAKLLKKKPNKVKIVDYIPEVVGEKTEYGWIYLPDRTIESFDHLSMGPIYFSVLERIN
jgi:16S rRNA C967 or C1407 C5-methylase (RsmB/RsmF family)